MSILKLVARVALAAAARCGAFDAGDGEDGRFGYGGEGPSHLNFVITEKFSHVGLRAAQESPYAALRPPQLVRQVEATSALAATA